MPTTNRQLVKFCGLYQRQVLRPKSPSKLWLSFGSGMQSSMVFRPSSFRCIIPHFIILAYSFISPFLIQFPHVFHIPLLTLFHVPHPQTPFQTPNPKLCSIPPCIAFPLFYFCFQLLFPTLCPFSMTLICSPQYLYIQNFMYVSPV